MEKIYDNNFLKNAFLDSLDECVKRTNSKIAFRSTNPENEKNPAYIATIINNDTKYHLSVLFPANGIDFIKVDVRDNAGWKSHIGEFEPDKRCEENLNLLINKAFDTKINNLENEKHIFCLEKIERRAKLAAETFNFYKDEEIKHDINKAFNDWVEILKDNYIKACSFLNSHLSECDKLEDCLDGVKDWQEVKELATRWTNEKMEKNVQEWKKELDDALKLEPGTELSQALIDSKVVRARMKAESEQYKNDEEKLWFNWFLNRASNIYNVHAQRLIQSIIDYELGMSNLCRQTEDLLIKKENITNEDRALMATLPLTIQIVDQELSDYRESHCIKLVNEVIDELEREGRLPSSAVRIEER